MGLRVPVGMQAQASPGMSGVESGEGGDGACEGMPGNRERKRGRRNDPNEKDLCRHCETISFCRLC